MHDEHDRMYDAFAPRAPGVVSIGLTGERSAVEAAALVLAQCPWAIVDMQRAYPGRFGDEWIAYGTMIVMSQPGESG